MVKLASRQGFEPRPTVLETVMLPLTPARYKLGVIYGYRTHTTAFTAQCADLYTNTTIETKDTYTTG